MSEIEILQAELDRLEAAAPLSARETARYLEVEGRLLELEAAIRALAEGGRGMTEDAPLPSGRDIWEVANQLEGYVGPNTPDDLARFLIREGKAAAELAEEIRRLRAALATVKETP